MNVIIREAKIEDAAEVANLHINSWRETYQYALDSEHL